MLVCEKWRRVYRIDKNLYRCEKCQYNYSKNELMKLREQKEDAPQVGTVLGYDQPLKQKMGKIKYAK